MPYSRKRGRTDGNLGAIVQDAERCGFLVHVRNDGLGDLDVQLAGIHEVWEVKTKTGKPTALQAKHATEGWRIRTVRTVEDVLQARIELHREVVPSPHWDRMKHPDGTDRGKGRPGRFITVGRR